MSNEKETDIDDMWLKKTSLIMQIHPLVESEANVLNSLTDSLSFSTLRQPSMVNIIFL